MKEEKLLSCNVVMSPAQRAVIGLCKIIKRVSKYSFSAKRGALGILIHEGDTKYWQPQSLYLTSNRELKVGDHCMFYGMPSKVLEINGTSAKIESVTITSKEDAKFINEAKGKIVTKEGNFSTMIHSFSVKQLPKIEASTDTSLDIPVIDEPFVHEFEKSQGKIRNVMVEVQFYYYKQEYRITQLKTDPKNNTCIILQAKANEISMTEIIDYYNRGLIRVKAKYRSTQNTDRKRIDYKQISKTDSLLIDLYEDILADLKKLAQ